MNINNFDISRQVLIISVFKRISSLSISLDSKVPKCLCLCPFLFHVYFGIPHA